MKSRLKLDENTYLELRIPSCFEFTPNDIEIWFVENDSEQCVYHDSYKDEVLNGEVFYVINKFFNADEKYRSFENFIPRFIQFCKLESDVEDLYDHILFERGIWIVWLCADGSDARIIVTKITHKHYKKFKCKKEMSFLVDRNSFKEWCEFLFTLDEEVLEEYDPESFWEEVDKKKRKFEEEIAYREKLTDKISKNDDLSEEERTWLVTHSVFNKKLGYPFCNVDIINLKPNVTYKLKIMFESFSDDYNFFPVIRVPDHNGSIIADCCVCGSKCSRRGGKPVKALAFRGNPDCREYEVEFKSSTGLLSVSYECEFYDEKTKAYVRQSSSVDVERFAMRREEVFINLIRYFCKSPLEDYFGKMTTKFMVELVKEEEGLV